MAAELAVQQAIFGLLRADTTLRSLLAEHADEGSPTAPAVYDHVPQVLASEDPANFPLVALGDDTAIEFDTDDVDGHEHTVTLHVFDRYEGRKRVKQILGALHELLHNTQPAVAGLATVYCFWEFSGSVPDPDVQTQHAVTRFRIVTQGS
jgi:hypothetical protein